VLEMDVKREGDGERGVCEGGEGKLQVSGGGERRKEKATYAVQSMSPSSFKYRTRPNRIIRNRRPNHRVFLPVRNSNRSTTH
jgi:hypothetical protein